MVTYTHKITWYYPLSGNSLCKLVGSETEATKLAKVKRSNPKVGHVTVQPVRMVHGQYRIIS